MTDSNGMSANVGGLSKRNSFVRPKQSGASAVEYLVVAAVVVAMLFLPVPGHGESVMEMMIEGVKDSHHRYVWGMSYPYKGIL